jgi:hypothetical protein
MNTLVEIHPLSTSIIMYEISFIIDPGSLT